MWTQLALLLMIILSGFIAYYGDLQGRRWGKKRVSWFGLRPKHTAILITSLTGAMIALLSVGAMLAVWPSLRDLVLNGERKINELNREQQKYKKDLQVAQVKLKMNSAEISTQEQTIQDLKRDRAAEKAASLSVKVMNADLEKRNAAL